LFFSLEFHNKANRWGNKWGVAFQDRWNAVAAVGLQGAAIGREEAETAKKSKRKVCRTNGCIANGLFLYYKPHLH
jgi:hypothetical protein